MEKAIIYFWSLIIFCGLHIVATAFIFFHLKMQLKRSNLDSFKRILGISYQRRALTNSWAKYKWVIGFTVVRACFDEQGELMEFEIKPYSFFPARYRKSFSV